MRVSWWSKAYTVSNS